MMSPTKRIGTSRQRWIASGLAGALVVLVVVVIVAVASGGSSTSNQASGVGQPPPEWGANAGSWPAHNHDLANTRATSQTGINSQNVSSLKPKWSFPLKGASAFGVFSSTPIVIDGTVYLQDLN